MNRTAMKHSVQDRLMSGIASTLGYWEERYAPDGWESWTEPRRQEYRDIMRHEADRVAKLFGFDEAWVN